MKTVRPITIRDCTITNGFSLPVESYSAMIALARAAEENARAITAIANGLKGSSATMEAGIKITNPE